MHTRIWNLGIMSRVRLEECENNIQFMPGSKIHCLALKLYTGASKSGGRGEGLVSRRMICVDWIGLTMHNSVRDTLVRTLMHHTQGCHIWVGSKFPDISLTIPWHITIFPWQFILFFQVRNKDCALKTIKYSYIYIKCFCQKAII